jgi:hypothetical protein
LDDDIASAEEAQAFAKRNVHVERDGGFSALGFFVDFFEVGGAEGIVPDRRGGIAGVARAGTVVARNSSLTRSSSRMLCRLGFAMVTTKVP